MVLPAYTDFLEGGVVNVINSVGKLKVLCDPIPLLLGIVDTLEAPQANKTFVFYAAFYSRKVILLHWKGSSPPTTQFWRTLINKALPLYKLTYLACNCPKKCAKIWDPWVCEEQLALE